MSKLHIGYHKTGTTWLQQLIFPFVPNYEGRWYDCLWEERQSLNICSKSSPRANKEPTDTILNGQFHGARGVPGADALLKHFSQQEDIIYSCETFLNIPHEELFKLLKKYPSFNEVLVTTRNFTDLIRSRTTHDTPHFYLQPKLRKGVIDDEVKLHYSTDHLQTHIPNLTIVDMDKIWSIDNNEVHKLSTWLGVDIRDQILKHVHKKINET